MTCTSRWVWEVATSVPQPALLSTLHQPVPGCCISQFFLHHACYSGRCHCCPQRVCFYIFVRDETVWGNNCVICHVSVFFFVFFFVSNKIYLSFCSCVKWLKINSLYIKLALRFHSLVIDVTMALDTLSLPVLEPLTPGRLLDMTVLALSCLYAGGW